MNVFTEFVDKDGVKTREVEPERRAMVELEQIMRLWFDAQLRAEKEYGPDAPVVRLFEHKYRLVRERFEDARYRYDMARIKALADMPARRAA